MRTYPEDAARGRDALRAIDELDAATLIILVRMAYNELSGRSAGTPTGVWLFADRPSYRTLSERGLIERTPPRHGTPTPPRFGERPYEFCRLTNEGRELGRFFTAREITPEYLWPDD